MSAVISPLRTDAVAEAPARRDLLRFITCGSVDDGKSTLIGRLLYDSRQLLDDQLGALARDSHAVGQGEGALDLALLVDGLAAEREQGITIDVAYRFFGTERRSFIVADTPGHEQYTRNMATGASRADAAVLLVDARKGLSRQTRRHSLLVSMLGIRHVVLAVNKMDLVGWSQERFGEIRDAYRDFSAELGFHTVVAIPMAAKLGDNVTRGSQVMPWYAGPDLLTHLEELDAGPADSDERFRLAVQWVNRPNADFRGYAGLVSGGPVQAGQPVVVHPSGARTSVARIVTYDGDLDAAEPGRSVTLTLANEVDVSRGCVIAAVNAPTRVSSVVGGRLFWMADARLVEGATFLAKVGTLTTSATLRRIVSRIDLDTLAASPAGGLAPNDVGDVVLQFDRPVPLDTFSANRDGGTFILIDRETFDTVAMGLVLDIPEREAAAEELPSRAGRGSEMPAWLPTAFAAPWRSIVKAASWRVIGTLLTVAATYALTGDSLITLVLGAFELSVKFALQLGHERLWTHLGFGLRFLKPPPAPSGDLLKG